MATRRRTEGHLAAPSVEQAMAALCREMGRGPVMSPEEAFSQGYRSLADWMPHVGASSADAAAKVLCKWFADGKVERVKVDQPGRRAQPPSWYRVKQ